MRSVERIGFRGGEFERLREIDDAEMGEAVFALVEGEMGLEDVGGGEHDVRARGDEFAPEFAARVFDGDGHQAKGAAEGVGADEEGAAEVGVFFDGGAWMVIDVVFVRVFAGGDDAEFAGGLIGAEVVDFARGVAGGR